MKKYYRSKDESFANLKDFSYEAKFIDEVNGFKDYAGLRMAYIDEGDKQADLTFVMLHGSPTWSYLWRHFIKEVVDANYRAVAFDMIGFGRSDKPLDEEAYTFDSMRESIIFAIEAVYAVRHLIFFTFFCCCIDLINIRDIFFKKVLN